MDRDTTSSGQFLVGVEGNEWILSYVSNSAARRDLLTRPIIPMRWILSPHSRCFIRASSGAI